MNKKRIIGLNGSASLKSTNIAILNKIGEIGKSIFDLEIIEYLNELPHFQTEITDDNVPEKVVKLRNEILEADGIIISTPEYVFSIPSRLKNAIEWCVSTTVFSDKPLSLITASASGEKGHDELKLIMKTVQAKFTEETTLLIGGAKGKFDEEGNITDKSLEQNITKVVNTFIGLINNPK